MSTVQQCSDIGSNLEHAEFITMVLPFWRVHQMDNLSTFSHTNPLFPDMMSLLPWSWNIVT